MPALIRELALAGSRKSDGSANSSGKVFLYNPGTTTIVAGYTDDTLAEAHATVDGGIALDAGGRVTIYINDIVDVVVSDSDGATIETWLNYSAVRAEQVEVENDGYTGAITESSGAVSQGLGGKTNVDTVLTSAFESLGPDFEYKESTGATARPYIEVIRGMQVSVKDFGARGDGVADDTTPIQLALNEAKRLSCVCFIDPGTYNHSANLVLTSATGVIIRGAGNANLRSTSTSVDCLTLTSCTGCRIENLEVTPAATSTGRTIVVTSCQVFSASRVTATNGAIGMDITGSSVTLTDCGLRGSGASGRGLKSAAVGLTMAGGLAIAGSGAAIEFTGAAANTTLVGVNFGSAAPSSPTGILFNAALSGVRFSIIGCPTLGLQTTPIDVSGVTIWPGIRQRDNGVIPAGLSFATGTTQTPILKLGNEIRLTASSGGAGTVTLADPAVLPSGTDAVELYWDFIFKNAAGGAVTWDFTAVGTVYDFAAAIPTTAAHTIAVRMRWDPTTSSLREMSRADTVT